MEEGKKMRIQPLNKILGEVDVEEKKKIRDWILNLWTDMAEIEDCLDEFYLLELKGHFQSNTEPTSNLS